MSFHIAPIFQKRCLQGMESSIAQVLKPNRHLCSSLLTATANAKNPSKIDSCFLPSSSSLRLQQPHGGRLRVQKEVKCASVSWGREFGDEEVITEEEIMRLGNLGHKCKEARGIAELLECLESEAIMGEDEGREATDYNRRAQIFDKSSRVFQALKQSSTTANATPVVD